MDAASTDTHYVSFLSSDLNGKERNVSGSRSNSEISSNGLRHRRGRLDVVRYASLLWNRRGINRSRNIKVALFVLLLGVPLVLFAFIGLVVAPGRFLDTGKGDSGIDDLENAAVHSRANDYSSIHFYEETSVITFPENVQHWGDVHFEHSFDNFMRTHEKSYDSVEEKARRFGVFKANMYYIHVHNQQGHSYKLAINKFGDLTNKEFRKLYMGFTARGPRSSSQAYLGIKSSLRLSSTSTLPVSVDWRDRGCVTPVKDQGVCGSCWAFSSTGAIEAAWCAKTGSLLSLSEQQLMDCSRAEGNNSCNGGTMDVAFDYVARHGGLCLEDAYPYEATNHEKCAEKKCKHFVKIAGFYDVPPNDEKAIKNALSLHGPVSVGIDAGQTAFQFYADGLFEAECGTELNHGVLLVGYGTDLSSKKDFFILKNSWGSGWGTQGYMHIAQHKGKEGECGLLMMPSIPLVKGEDPPIPDGHF